MASRTTRLVALGLAIAAVETLLAVTHAGVVLRVPLGLMVVFVVPGVLGSLAFFGRLPLTWVEWGVAVAASLGLTIVAGFALNLVPSGLTTAGWSVTMLLVVAVLALLAWRRTADWRPAADDGPAPTSRAARPRVTTVIGLLACVGLVAAGVVVSVQSQQTAANQAPFTELWLTKTASTVDTVHVRSHEDGELQYRADVTVGSGPTVRHPFRLAPGATWTLPIDAAPTKAGAATPSVSVDLYREGVAGPYRRVAVTGAAQ